MNINKAFFVETKEDGSTYIYNIGKKFFTKPGKPNGIMERFSQSKAEDKNKYINSLIKNGWLPLSRDYIEKIRINACGVITEYPFKYRKGYISIEKIEVIAKEMNHKWKHLDHDTNPFSALEDYSDFVEGLNKNANYNTVVLKKAINDFGNRLSNIGAIEQIENFFTEMSYIPDPRRFNRTIKELWKHYGSHLKDCCRLVWDDIYGDEDENFEIGSLIEKFKEIKSLQQHISNAAFKQRININDFKW